jgi:glycosyltransferase involved in cell wall biosynthesis
MRRPSRRNPRPNSAWPGGLPPGDVHPTVVFVAVPSALGGSNQALVTLLEQLSGQVERVVAGPLGGGLENVVRSRSLAEGWIPIIRRGRGDRLMRILGAIRVAIWVTRRRRNVLAIHANATTGFYVAFPAAVVSRVPLVVWIHDSVSTPWGLRLGGLRHLLPRVRWLAVSEAGREVLVRNGLCESSEVVIVPNPIDPVSVVARDRPPAARPHEVRVGFLGSATDAKGFDLLPTVIGATSDLPVVWKLFVSAPGETPHPAWAQLKNMRRGVVERPGRVRDVRQAYAAVDIVFVPSRFESFSRVAAEALLNGIPVIASDLPPLRALLGTDGGMLFQVGDAQAAASAIRELAADRERWSVWPTPRGNLNGHQPAAVAREMLEAYLGVGRRRQASGHG